MDSILTLLLQMQLQRNLAKDSVPAEQLAPAIFQLSKEYEVDPELVMRIVIVESKGRAKAYNKRTKDYGIMQVNKSTAWLYGVKESCLLDWRCGLEAGIMILSDLQDYKNYRHCTYNVGPKWKNKPTACMAYEARLEKVK